MKNIACIVIGALMVVFTSCVDDYTDANPPSRLDAPTLRVSAPTADNVLLLSTPVNNYQSEPELIMKYGEPVELTVSVIDAPGEIGAITVTSSIPEYGTVTVDEASTAALQNQETGSFKFTFTPADNFDDESDRSFNIVVTVADKQLDEDGNPAPKTTTMTIPVTLAKCISTTIPAGFYIVTELDANEDGGAAITLDDIEGALGERAVVEITTIRPGLYEFDDVTAGVWPVYYGGRAPATVQIDACNNVLSGHEGAVTAGAGTPVARTFTINGMVNEGGTVTVDWSYVRDDGTTPLIPASGTYTLTPISGF